MHDLSAIATNLTRSDAGIWVSRNQGAISYPDDGNDACFAVEDSSFWFRHRNEAIVHLATAHSPSRTFFDIGGGNGCVSHALQRAGLDVVLVEPGAAGVRNALRRGVRRVIQSTLEDAGFEPGTLPSAGMFDVLEHLERDGQFLEGLHAYLQPGGHLYLTVPAYSALWSFEDVHAGHFRRYTTRSLSVRLKEAGFRLLYSSYLFSFLVPPIFLLRSLPSLLGLRQSVSAATTRREHSAGGGVSATVVQKCLDFELARIRRGKRIPVGSSCLAVAVKTA